MHSSERNVKVETVIKVEKTQTNVTNIKRVIIKKQRTNQKNNVLLNTITSELHKKVMKPVGCLKPCKCDRYFSVLE